MFNGHAHENGFVGNNYAIGFALDIRDAQGRAPSIVHEKKLSGTVDIGGDRNDDFVVQGFDQLIADNWDQVKSARVFFRLHASTDVGQVLELIGESLVAAFAGVGVVVGLVKLAGAIVGLGLTLSVDGHVNSGGDKGSGLVVEGPF